MKVAVPWQVTLALLFAGGVGIYVWKSGGLSGAFKGLADGVLNAASGAATGVVNAAGAAVGLPSTDQLTSDPKVTRWLIDNVSSYQASRWSTAGAYIAGLQLNVGDGAMPPAGSAIALAFPSQFAGSASYDETSRLLNNHPADGGTATNIFGGEINFSDPTTFGMGL